MIKLRNNDNGDDDDNDYGNENDDGNEDHCDNNSCSSSYCFKYFVFYLLTYFSDALDIFISC